MNYHHQYNRDAAHQQQNQYGQLASHQNGQAAAGSSDGSYAQYGAAYPHYPQDARTGTQTQASGTLHMQQAAYSQPAYGQYYGAVPAAAPRQTAPQQTPSPLQHHAAPPSMNTYQQQTYQYPSQQIHQRYAPAPAQSDGAMNANAGIGRSSAGHSGALHGLLNDDGGSWPDVAASGTSTTWNQPAASSQGYSMQLGNASHAAVSMPVEAYGTAQTTYSPQIAVQPGPRMAEQPQASRAQPAQYQDMQHAQYQTAQTSQYQTAQSSPYQTQSSQYQPAQSSQYPTTQSSQYHTAQSSQYQTAQRSQTQPQPSPRMTAQAQPQQIIPQPAQYQSTQTAQYQDAKPSLYQSTQSALYQDAQPAQYQAPSAQFQDAQRTQTNHYSPSPSVQNSTLNNNGYSSPGIMSGILPRTVPDTTPSSMPNPVSSNAMAGALPNSMGGPANAQTAAVSQQRQYQQRQYEQSQYQQSQQYEQSQYEAPKMRDVKTAQIHAPLHRTPQSSFSRPSPVPQNRALQRSASTAQPSHSPSPSASGQSATQSPQIQSSRSPYLQRSSLSQSPRQVAQPQRSSLRPSAAVPKTSRLQTASSNPPPAQSQSKPAPARPAKPPAAPRKVSFTPALPSVPAPPAPAPPSAPPPRAPPRAANPEPPLPQVVNPADLFVSPAQLQYNRPKSPPRQPLTHLAVPPITDEELNMRPTLPKSVKEPADQSQGGGMSYDALLLTLSEEYLDAAHSLGPKVARIPDNDVDEAEVELFETYTKLITASLGCLEAALKNFNFSPPIEAAIILHYGTIMYEETENYDDIETVLSRGLTLCERVSASDFLRRDIDLEKNKLLGLKYSIHHLLVRVIFKKNRTAAIRSLDTVITEVEAYKNTPWVYALRFLRVSLSLQIATHHEVLLALQQLRVITNLARTYDDKAIAVICASLEAMAHLQTESAEGVINSQEAIARARKHQMHTSVQSIPQVWTFLSCVDLACSMMEYKVDQVSQKLKTLQEVTERFTLEDSEDDGGVILVPLGISSAAQLDDYSDAIFETPESGRPSLRFAWLRRQDVEALGYLMSGSASFFRDAIETKTAAFMTEGLAAVEKILRPDGVASDEQPPDGPGSRKEYRLFFERSSKIKWYLGIYQIFNFCLRCRWKDARLCLNAMQKELASDAFEVTEELERWLVYMQAMIEQGTGNLDAARRLFRSPLLREAPKLAGANKRLGQVHDDLWTLSRLHLFLMGGADDGDVEDEGAIDAAMATLRASIPDRHPNDNLRCALALASATKTGAAPTAPGHRRASSGAGGAGAGGGGGPPTITRKKAELQRALELARALSNAQLLALSMSAFVGIFFAHITVGEQARKSRSTARGLALKGGDPLWVAVADGMLLQAEEEGGRRDGVERELQANVGKLGDAVRARFVVGA